MIATIKRIEDPNFPGTCDVCRSMIAHLKMDEEPAKATHIIYWNGNKDNHNKVCGECAVLVPHESELVD